MDFLKKISANKKLFSCLGLLVLAVLFFPLSAQAFIPEILAMIKTGAGGLGETVASGIVGFIFGTLKAVPLFILQFALDALNWVASGDFLAVKFTNTTSGTTGYNPLVAIGWGFTRNLANVILIFGLVIIALSIIMGYQETRAKKTLVNFVLIAALINFTPVIAGLVIDLAQVIMNLLLKGGAAPSYTTSMITQMANLQTADLPTIIILTVFCLFAAIVYLLFALLFLVRIVMLWILIILSPIAFATKVMPDEVQKVTHYIFPSITNWDEWWKQFLQWCFVGIPAAGAIWLSNVMMVQIANNPGNIFSTPSGSTLTGPLGVILSFLVPFIILINGLFISLDSGGWAGGKIKGYANKIWGATGGAALGAATGYAVGRGKALGNWTKEGIVGSGGAIYSGKNPLDASNREEGRQNWKKFKKETVDQARSTRILGSFIPKTKEYEETEAYSGVKPLNKASMSDLKKNLGDMSNDQKTKLRARYLKNHSQMTTKLKELEEKLSMVEKTNNPEAIKLAQNELTTFARKVAIMEYHLGITEERGREINEAETEMFDRPSFY